MLLRSKGPYHHLIKRACRSDQAALREIYDLLFDNVSATVFAFNFSVEETEDLVQESFIKIFRQLPRYDHRKSKLTTWSALIARGLAIKYAGKRRLDTTDLNMAKIISVVPDNCGDHLEHAIIIDQVDRLPVQYKEVFVLAVLEDLDHATIAGQLGISPSTSRVYLARAKTQLQKKLAHLRTPSTFKAKSI